MSPQFVDFDQDGKLDIVAGIFDGSPHLVRGSDQGWQKPEQIFDRDGARIVFNQFWDFDNKKWETTNRSDQPGQDGKGHLTSAIAMDLDGDGDLDLLLGDHAGGHVYSRINEGTAQKPAFATKNGLVLADGKPIDVPGTVATLRLVDWNGDGLMDLACGSMGDAFGQGEGGGVYVFLNVGSKQAPKFAAPITLLERSQKGTHEPTRPDSGLYMDFGDIDGDGDLDMIVGAYSQWTPLPRQLTNDEEQRGKTLHAELDAVGKASEALQQTIEAAVTGLDAAAADTKRAELREAKGEQFAALGKRRQAAQQELETFEPGAKRMPFVWLYENRRLGKAPPAPK